MWRQFYKRFSSPGYESSPRVQVVLTVWLVRGKPKDKISYRGRTGTCRKLKKKLMVYPKNCFRTSVTHAQMRWFHSEPWCVITGNDTWVHGIWWWYRPYIVSKAYLSQKKLKDSYRIADDLSQFFYGRGVAHCKFIRFLIWRHGWVWELFFWREEKVVHEQCLSNNEGVSCWQLNNITSLI